MSDLQTGFYVLDLLGVAALVVMTGFAALRATCGEGPTMRRSRGRR